MQNALKAADKEKPIRRAAELNNVSNNYPNKDCYIVHVQCLVHAHTHSHSQCISMLRDNTDCHVIADHNHQQYSEISKPNFEGSGTFLSIYAFLFPSITTEHRDPTTIAFLMPR